MKFELEEDDCIIRDVNPRTEKRGEDSILACDIKIEIVIDNDRLAMFSSTLRSALYQPIGDVEGDLADAGMDPEALIKPRFPHLGVLNWDEEMLNATVNIRRHVSKRAITLADAKVNKFRLEPREGGRVGITFRVQAVVSNETIGHLAGLLDTEAQIEVAPLALGQQSVE